MLCELVDQRALTGAGCARYAEDSRLSSMLKKCFEQIGPPYSAILHRRDGLRESAGVTSTETSNLGLGILSQGF